jgi:predicted phage terminase large subunit-like protein
VIADDIEDDQSVESKEQRDKLDRWFRRVVSNIVGPGGKLFIIGTILHHDSLLSRLLKQTDVFTTRIWRAIQEDGKPLWPARWPLTRLEAKKREITPRNFATEFMNDAANEEEQIFSPNKFKYFKDEDLSGLELNTAGAIDPAIGQKAKNDDSAIAVAGEAGGNYYLLSMRMGHWKVQKQVEMVLSTARQWPKLLKFGVETVAYQEALKQLLDEACQKDNLQIPLVAAEDISSDKLRRISTLAPMVEQGRLWFPSASSSYWTPDVAKCIEQFEALGCSTNAHDDGPDAVERAVRLLRGRSGKKGKVRLI